MTGGHRLQASEAQSHTSPELPTSGSFRACHSAFWHPGTPEIQPGGNSETGSPPAATLGAVAALKGLLLGHHASSLDLCRQKPWAGVDGEGALAGELGVFKEESPQFT